jgi:hypothetical protein
MERFSLLGREMIEKNVLEVLWNFLHDPSTRSQVYAFQEKMGAAKKTARNITKGKYIFIFSKMKNFMQKMCGEPGNTTRFRT